MSGEVPEGWKQAALGDIADITRGVSWRDENETDEATAGALPVLGIRNVRQSLKIDDTVWLAGLSQKAVASSTVRFGDILMVGSNGNPARIGNAVRIDVPGVYLYASLLFGVRPDEARVDGDFLFHLIRSSSVQRAISDTVQGSTGLANLKITVLREIPLLLPPLDEQRRIAEVLRSVDEAIHLNAGSIVGFKRLLAALRAELTYDADVPPAGTKSVSLHDLCRPRQHPTISSKQLTDSGYPTFGANGQIGFYTSYTHENPVIAITCRGATCGTINWIPAKSYLTGNAMALDDVRHDLINERYLFHYLSAWGVAKSIAGSAQPQITRQSLSGIKIAMPPMEEQVSIAAILDSSLTQLEAANFTYSTLLTTRSQVASDLLSGCVRVPA